MIRLSIKRVSDEGGVCLHRSTLSTHYSSLIVCSRDGSDRCFLEVEPYLQIVSGPDPNHQATNNFLVVCKALLLVQGFDHITIQWYRLEDSGAPIAEFVPHTVPLVALGELGAPGEIWPPPAKAAPRYPPKPHQGEPQPQEGVLDEGDDLEDPDEELQDGEGNAIAPLEEDELFDLVQVLEAVLEEDPRMDGPDIDGGHAQPPEGDALVPAAGGGGEAAPPAVPEALARAPVRASANRRGATVTMQVEGGSISYYPSKQAFEAVCEVRGHGRCVLTRTCKGKFNAEAGRVVGGRPCGFLAAWLAQGPGVATKAAHWAPELLARPLEERASVREQIRTSGEAGPMLLGAERPQEAGEPAEPVTLQGYGVL